MSFRLSVWIGLVLLFFSGGLLLSRCNSHSTNPKSTQPDTASTKDTAWWKPKAEQMVELQIKERNITNERVLTVMKNVPRHRFVPKRRQDDAYRDRPLPIGAGQTISQPYIVALMTAKLELTGGERVLEIGTGSGYQAAILAHLVDSVFTIEIKKSLARQAKTRLSKMGYNNVVVRQGNGYKGWASKALFDAIIVTAAPPEVPEALKNQLKVGGRMILPVGNQVQELILLTKKENGQFKKETITPVRFVPMIHPHDE